MIRKHIFANGEDVADVQGERHNHQGIASGRESRSEPYQAYDFHDVHKSDA
jgi:hypothetical protein